MRFESTPLPGAVVIERAPHADERGSFARTWCSREFAEHGLPTAMLQANQSRNARRGTLRGMHFQWPPSREGKLVRCERGAIFDAIIDLRPDSVSFQRHFNIVLDAQRGNALFVPPGFAHGFQTLVDDTWVGYLMTDYYEPSLSDGVRWSDPAFGIDWPLPVTAISGRDRDYPDFDAAAHAARFDQGRLRA